MAGFVPAEQAESINRGLPSEITKRGFDPVVTLLVTLYVLRIGQTSGEELAASAGFPVFPAAPRTRLDLAQELRYIPLDPQWTSGVIETLETSLSAASLGAAAEGLPTEQRLLAAAIFNQDERTDAQRRELRNILSVISASSSYDREDIEDWNRGLRAIARVTRLMIEAVAPTRIGTMRNLTQPDSGLRTISTLGGALFLGHSIEVLTRGHQVTPPSRYAELSRRFALLTGETGEQRVNLPGPEAAARYEKDLARFASSSDSTFTIEHPFHFRVLLELLSDENRRYPAEPVLNAAALRLILPGTFWSHVVWSRDQLPVVVNLLALPERQRADAYIQHYAAFGRTPHTSSFTHLDYEVHSPVADDAVTESWPAEFQEYRGTSIRNVPNSVAQVNHAIRRQRSLGRLWRGTPGESDLRWLCGQLVAWDGYTEPDGALADRIWDSERWTGQTFPVAALAEIRVGAWLLEALRLRLETAVWPALHDAELYHDEQRLDRERRSNEELRCVLAIMAMFAADYLTGDEQDGIPGLKETLRQLRYSDCFTTLGPTMSKRLDFLEAALDEHGARLGTEVRRAGETPQPE
jgi:hypothetical protein